MAGCAHVVLKHVWVNRINKRICYSYPKYLDYEYRTFNHVHPQISLSLLFRKIKEEVKKREVNPVHPKCCLIGIHVGDGKGGRGKIIMSSS